MFYRQTSLNLIALITDKIKLLKQMNKQAVIIEINEVPLRILEYYRGLNLNSTISHLLSQSLVLRTEAKDVEKSLLYPSQTWASLNTGVPYTLHKIREYNDPKPHSYPLYWKILAKNGLNVGLVNTLHSSPLNSYINHKSYKFVIPDCFAKNNLTKPDNYQCFQELNIRATLNNGRVINSNFPYQKALKTLLKSSKLGIKAKTIINAATLVSQLKIGKVNKGRLRNIQFTLLADIFFKQIQTQNVDLAVFFTNHIAANMHRYWYALFPEDYEIEVYHRKWIDKFSSEILISLDLLDNFLHKLITYCQKNQRVLILVSSMGQTANRGLRETPMYSYKLKNIQKFLDKLCMGEQYEYQIEAAMIPRYSLNFTSENEAKKCFQSINELKTHLKNIHLKVSRNKKLITINTQLSSNTEHFFIKDKNFSYDDLGFQKIHIEDHHSGKHCPEGSLIIYNSGVATTTNQTVDYLEYAPAMLKFFGLDIPQYMLKTQFTI